MPSQHQPRCPKAPGDRFRAVRGPLAPPQSRRPQRHRPRLVWRGSRPDTPARTLEARSMGARFVPRQGGTNVPTAIATLDTAPHRTACPKVDSGKRRESPPRPAADGRVPGPVRMRTDPIGSSGARYVGVRVGRGTRSYGARAPPPLPEDEPT